MKPTVELSLALAGLNAAELGLASAHATRAGADRGEEVRATIAWASEKGFRAVQVDATAAGVRPRELDRSGRRDLAATIRRADLRCSGLDLWIPSEHFADPAHADRAVSAALGAIDLAAELAALATGSIVSTGQTRGGGIVSLVLPSTIGADVLASITDRARARSVTIADHAWPMREATEEDGGVGVGIDPATILSTGEDAAAVAARLGARLASARLSDVARVGGGRIAAGSRGGRLDVLSYMVALATGGYTRPIVADLRGVTGQPDAVEQILAAVHG